MTVRDLMDLVGPDGLDTEIALAICGGKGVGFSRSIDNAKIVDHKNGEKEVCIWGYNDTIQISDTKETKKYFADIRKRNREYAKAEKA